MPDIQTAESVTSAKQRLREIEEQKNGTARAATDGERKSKADIIRPTSAKAKKKPFGRKLKEAFFGEHLAEGSTADYLFFRVFIPRFKQIMADMANSAINSAFGLDNRTRTLNGGNTHQANANTYRDRNYARVNSVGSTRRDAISEMEWDAESANDIYSQIMEIFEQGYELTLEDVYSIMGRGTQIRSTDRLWGWTSPRGIELVCVDEVHDIWIIDMPAARAL